MRVSHVSDSHNNSELVTQACKQDVDLVIVTGDCLSNYGRVSIYGISPVLEIPFQETWLNKVAPYWVEALNGKPVLFVRGNHDFIEYNEVMKSHGANSYEITDKNPEVVIEGIKFAGFRQIPYIMGEWAGEEYVLHPHVERAFRCNPDVLITHCPPSGILDGSGYGKVGWGISDLTNRLFYTEHNVKYHFFGHVHEKGGLMEMHDNIRFYNSACRIQNVEIIT